MKEDPGASNKRVIIQVKAKIYSEDIDARLAHTASLPVQGWTVRELDRFVAQNWTTAISTLFVALNSVTMLLLVKLSCSTSSVNPTSLWPLFWTPTRKLTGNSVCWRSLSTSWKATWEDADHCPLARGGMPLSQDIASMDLWPDIVIWTQSDI